MIKTKVELKPDESIEFQESKVQRRRNGKLLS